MRELSIFIDESGDIGDCSEYYLVTFILHDQSTDISEGIDKYRKALGNASLPEKTFLFAPVLRGHKQYENLDIETRKGYLIRFHILVEKMPFHYFALSYRKSEHVTVSALAESIEKNLIRFLQDHLAYFQKFDKVKVYYDNGQRVVTHAVHRAVRACLAQSAAVYREALPRDYYLSQIADYVCGIELAALRYEKHVDNPTDHRFFGDRRNFSRNYLR